MNKVVDLNSVIQENLDYHLSQEHYLWVRNNTNLATLRPEVVQEVVYYTSVSRFQRLKETIETTLGTEWGVLDRMQVWQGYLDRGLSSAETLWKKDVQDVSLRMYNNLLAQSEGSSGAFVGALACISCHYLFDNPSESSRYAARAYSDYLYSENRRKDMYQQFWELESKKFRFILEHTRGINDFWN